MKRILTIIFVCLTAVCQIEGRAETVSQKQAQKMAQQFFNEAAGRVVAPVKLVYNGRKLTTGRLFIPFYIYNQPAGGFVIISAENKAFPILGFSLKDNFDPDRLGETETELLRSYAHEIEMVRYDSSVPYEAVEAWTYFPEYVNNILTAVYDATDPTISITEADDMLASWLEFDHATFSDIYTPGQWQAMVIDELKLNRSVPLWVIGNYAVFPMIAYGHQGDYFRLEMESRNSWLMRLNATELISSNMMAVINYPIELNDNQEIEAPFTEYDTFANEVAMVEDARRDVKHPELMIVEEGPVTRALGSGHFEIILPEDASVALIYNLGGAMIRQKTFAGSNVVNIDLAAEPQGFYFVNIYGESGTPYGVKLYR